MTSKEKMLDLVERATNEILYTLDCVEGTIEIESIHLDEIINKNHTLVQCVVLEVQVDQAVENCLSVVEKARKDAENIYALAKRLEKIYKQI